MIRVFSEHQLQPKEILLSEVETLLQASNIFWLDISNETDEITEVLLTQCGCHELAIQDALRTRHPPKIEEFEENLFILYRGMSQQSEGLDIGSSQIAFFVNKGFLITVHRDASLGINAIAENNKLGEWINNPPLLMSRILNNSAQIYLEKILKTDEMLSEVEDNMEARGSDDLLETVISYKAKLRRLNRTFSYHEKLLSQALKAPSKHLMPDFEDNIHALRDVYDKFERLESLSSMYYDLSGDLIDGYLSLASHQLNKTMQVLTVITAIFIPLGFLAGIYGMNFTNMPELGHPKGYFVLLGTMTFIAITLITIFKRKKWL